MSSLHKQTFIKYLAMYMHYLITASDVCTIECNDQFYCSNNFCKPHCARFRDYSKEVTVAIDVMIIIGAIVGLLGGIAVLIISVIKRKRMYVYICMHMKLLYYGFITLQVDISYNFCFLSDIIITDRW